jgi:small-conductance mechanosensitive channel
MTYATIQEINTSIIAGNFTNEQLTSIGDAIRYARTQLSQTKIREFRKGDTVKFTSAKRGVTIVGTVEKVAIKYVTVREASKGTITSGLWKVPANMLEAA